MKLYLNSTPAAIAGITIAGATAYAVYRTGVLRPAMVGTIKVGVKAGDWVEKQYAKARERAGELAAQVRSRVTKEAPVAVK